MNSGGQQTHRAGPLKQQNKSHKRGRHRTNRELAVAQKGKVDMKKLSKKHKNDLGREERRHKMNQLRNKKRSETLQSKRSLGGVGVPPLSVLVYSTDGNISLGNLLNYFTEQQDIQIDRAGGRCFTVIVPKFKLRYQFFTVPDDDLYALMDGVKSADMLLLVHSLSTDVDSLKNNLYINSIFNHFLPTTFHVVSGLKDLPTKKKSEVKTVIQKAVANKFGSDKLQTVDSAQDATQLLHLLGNARRGSSTFKQNRSYLFAQEIQADDDKFSISGYVRSKPLDVNRLVHLPGFGDFQIKTIEVLADPFPLKKGPDVEMSENKIIFPDPSSQESLESENAYDPSEFDEMSSMTDEIMREETGEDEDEDSMKKRKKKLPKGTSDYQAAWILDDDENEEDESDDEDDYGNEAAMEAKSDSDEDEEENDATEGETGETESEAPNDKYDDEMDLDEEEDAKKKFKAAKMNQMFPDEVDTPADVPARKRFAKYRGLKSFVYSKWDAKENLPPDYSRIFQFQNFQRTRKRVIKSDEDGVSVGCYVRVTLKQPSRALIEAFSDETSVHKKPLAMFSLLPHENKMSVVNVVIQAHPSLDEPIRSKERLIFHIGCRRFAVEPLFSAHTNGEKFKYEPFLRTDEATVATFYAPITYPPASVVVLKEMNDGSKKLVASGSLLSINPDRMIIKRIILSGHPFKINKRSAVVRYMFFNKEDILWFKPIELRSKYGRKGHIKEALGTHGHMKCVFDRQLSSMDTVLMNLYKRVYPKWTYDPHIVD